MVNLFYGSFDSANLNHRIIFSLANEKTMRQKELDYANNRKELPTFLPDRKDFDFNEPGALLLEQFCQRFGCVYDYETYAVFDKFDKYKKHDYQLSRVTIIHVYTNPMTMQKIVKAISRNKTWGSEIVQSSEDNVKFSNRNSDNLLQRKLDVLKLACNQKSDETTTLTLNEIVQENTTDIQPQKKKPTTLGRGEAPLAIGARNGAQAAHEIRGKYPSWRTVPIDAWKRMKVAATPRRAAVDVATSAAMGPNTSITAAPTVRTAHAPGIARSRAERRWTHAREYSSSKSDIHTASARPVFASSCQPVPGAQTLVSHAHQ